MLFNQPADAGIVLSGTRLIFDGAKREVSVNAQNTSDDPYVVQAWVEAQEGSSDTPFFVTPAISRIDGKREGLLRVLKVGNALPGDRESMYWLNVKEIPKMDNRDNVLQIAIRTRIKLFYRPDSIKSKPRGADMLEWSVVKDDVGGKCSLKVENTSAYYSIFSDLAVDYGNGIKDKLGIGPVEPLSTRQWSLPRCKDAIQVTYAIVNDFGATVDIPSFHVNLNRNKQRESDTSK
jgi:fimbrial chaperone protein